MTRHRFGPVLGVIAATVAVAVSASPAGSAMPAKTKVSSGPGRWIQLSSGPGMVNFEDPSVHRFGTTLQVVWTQDTSSSQDTLHTRILAADGAPASANLTMLRWNSVNAFPAILADGARRVIAFSGLDKDPYAGGDGYYLTSSNGKAWALANGTFGSYSGLYNSTGADATDAGGTPVLAYTAGFGNGYRAGFDALPPATKDNATDTQNGACCTYAAGVGYDATSTQTWMTWYSNDGKRADEGVDAQRLYPSRGTPVHAPLSSSSDGNGGVASTDGDQRVQVAARHGGGLYTAYSVGYPSAHKIALWKLGSRHPVVLSTKDGVQKVGVAAAPGGRLWVFWYNLGTGLLYATRTNPAGTRFGRVSTVRPPRGDEVVWTTAGDASNGRLDLVVNASVKGPGEQLFSTQVLPALSGRVSPGTIRSKRGGRVTVTISDAGAAVRGATVRYGSTRKRTDAHGDAVFTVAKGTHKGSVRLTYGESGYTGGTLRVRVS